MKPRARKFLSYYKPYKKLFFADMFCALLAAAISLIYPIIVRYITNDVLIRYDIHTAISIIIKLALLMLAIAMIELCCNFFISYKGHIMGAKMEYDMRLVNDDLDVACAELLAYIEAQAQTTKE